ncbi:MAG: hypothetical protein DMG89_23940 [Acidobacteria bacterium]|nr:MAG: hypothetical protein DMG89_23940 [Acidobacteriota bacterium]
MVFKMCPFSPRSVVSIIYMRGMWLFFGLAASHSAPIVLRNVLRFAQHRAKHGMSSLCSNVSKFHTLSIGCNSGIAGLCIFSSDPIRNLELNCSERLDLFA